MIHTGAWIIWTGCAASIAIATTNPFYLGPLVAACLVVYAAHRRAGAADPFRIFVLVAAGTLALRSALVVLGPVTAEAATAAFLEGARLAVMLCIYGAFNAVASAEGLLRLAPRRFHEPALAAALALSIAPRTIAAVGRVREAQRLRGIRIGGWHTLPALAVPVLETGMEEAIALAESMDARGHGRPGRSRYRVESFSLGSWLVSGGALIAAAAFIASGIGGGVDLSVSTYPLRWPVVSPWLVMATVLLCVPALLPRREAA